MKKFWQGLLAILTGRCVKCNEKIEGEYSYMRADGALVCDSCFVKMVQEYEYSGLDEVMKNEK